MNAATQRTWCIRLVVLLLAALAVPAIGQEFGILRVSSLDAALRDFETVARAAGTEADRTMILEPALELLGLEDAPFLDYMKPFAVVLPMEGLMLQEKGPVGAMPVKNSQAALDALVAAYASHDVVDGVHSFSTETGPALFVVEKAGYLVFSGTKELVTRFDPTTAWADADAPQGSVSLELFLEPVAPMIEMGLQAAEQGIREERQRQGAPDGEDGIAEGEAMAPVADMSLSFARWLVDNTSRVQIAGGVQGDNLVVHARVVPKAGSELAELAAAQSGELPRIARLVTADAAIVAAGEITLTPPLREVLGASVAGYMGTVSSLFEEMGIAAAESHEEAAGEQSFWKAYLEETGRLSSRSFACFRGDVALSLDLGGDGPLSYAWAQGFESSLECRTLTSDMVDRLQELAASFPESADELSLSDGPAVGGVPTYTMALAMSPDAGQAFALGEDDSAKLMTWLQGDGLVFRFASTDDLHLGVSGPDSDARLQRMIGGTSAPGGGLTETTFAPLPSRPGMRARIDLGRFLGGLAAWMPEGTEREEVRRNAEAFSGPAGRIPFGLLFDPVGVSLDVAVPLATVEAIGKQVAAEEEKARVRAEEAAAEAALRQDELPEGLDEDQLTLSIRSDAAEPGDGEPRIAGVDATMPVLIPGTRVEPVYPEEARRSGLGGRVIMQAVISRDGSLGDIQVLRAPQPDLGFSEAAIEAVRHWRYQPAMSGDQPVDVYFTIVVEFQADPGGNSDGEHDPD